jgi:hypothetical protein
LSSVLVSSALCRSGSGVFRLGRCRGCVRSWGGCFCSTVCASCQSSPCALPAVDARVDSLDPR